MHKNKNYNFLPRVLRIREVLYYLSTNINYFNREIRPHLRPIKLGSRAIGFDRLDLDRWVDENAGRDGWRPIHRGDLLWDGKKRRAYTNVKVSGTSTSNSSEDVFVAALERLHSKKRKKS